MAWEGPGFVDAHAHLLQVAAGVLPPYDLANPDSVAAYHRAVAARGSTPTDEPPEPLPTGELGALAAALEAGLQRARTLGLVEVWEAGLADRRQLEALQLLRERGPLPVRVRVLVASGLAGRDPSVLRRTGDPWLEVVGVKFYADGWLRPRTCALREPFADRPGDRGILFCDAQNLARRAAPYAEAGWLVATHAIGDRAVEAVLDAYEMVFGDDCPRASPRVEHAQVLGPDLVARMAAMGVVACIQPSFGHTDAPVAPAALGERVRHAYDWAGLLRAGVRVVAGSDFPIETLSPLVGLRRLVEGSAVCEPLEPAKALAIMTDPRAGSVRLDADPLRTPSVDSLAVEAIPATE